MNYVEPIRDKDLVKAIGNYLKSKKERDYIMYLIGIYSGLRISDILKLKVKDVRRKNYITIREKKTNKRRSFPITPLLKKELDFYIENKKDDEYLIKSNKGWGKPIGRERAYRILKEAGEQFGLYNLGTHTLRKTFGYHFYMQYKDVVMLQKIFNHSDPSITLNYIGIEQNYINKMMKGFKLL